MAKKDEEAATRKSAKVPEKKKYPLQVAEGRSLSWGGKIFGPGSEVKLHMLGSDKVGEKGQKERLKTLVDRGVIEENK